MDVVLNYFRTLPKRQVVRPWALAVPVLVLIVALPLLRPLRSPEPESISSNELSRLATIQSLGDEHTQEINRSPYYAVLRQKNPYHAPETATLGNHVYSDKAPVLQFLLAGAYVVIARFGVTFDNNPALVIYLLTILGSVIPVAATAGIIYRMGRLFELRRPWRTVLALAVTFGTGLISYAVVINSHAPAAALVLGACACLIHMTVTKRPAQDGAWLMASGFLAALAAVIDPTAIVFLAGLGLVIVALRWRKRLRLGGVLLYGIGAVAPVTLHAVLTVPVTGDLLPPSLHAEMLPPRDLAPTAAIAGAGGVDATPDVADDDVPVTNGGWVRTVALKTAQVLGTLVGSRGMLSHFPVLVLGLMGIGLVLRRHWPVATKVMAAVTLAGGAVIVAAYVWSPSDWSNYMFGPRWSIVFLPLLLFWSGAWLRKGHHPITWVVAAMLLAFSVGVSLVGTTAPFLDGAGRYTAGVALRQLLHPAPPPPERAILASN